MLRLAHGPLLRGLRGIVKTHEVDLLYSNNQPNRNLFLAILARDLGLPVAHHLRSMDLDSFGPEKARLVNETATDFFAISDECARRWQERGLDPEKMHTVYNGLPPLSPEPMELTREYGFDPATRVAVIVGKISWEKGHAFLLPALAKLAEKRPECALVVVGEGPRRAEMEALSASLGLQNRVVFTGYSNRATDIIAAADALAQPCMSDSFSRTVIEAMTLGVPVVASDTGGIREVLEDGVNGRLVSYGDEETMTTALEEVLFDDDARVQYADAGMQRAARSFNLSENIRFIAERLERAAGK
jgi:glycosyltransferase involved in cell wall biosynthesis